MHAKLLHRCFSAAAGLLLAAGTGMLAGTTAAAVSTPAAAGAASSVGGPISRSETLARAQWWINTYGVIYSQQQTNAKPDPEGDQRYRPDCSGFVSMAWHLPKKSDGWDRNTNDLAAFGDTTWLGSLDQLLPGDAILGVSYGHVALFDKWANDSRTQMWIYEEFSSSAEGRHVVKDKSWYLANGFRGLRYNKIIDAPAAVDDTAVRVEGDFNGDGRSDAAALYNYDNAHVRLFVFLSSGTGFAAPQVWWDSGPGVWEWGRTKLVSADFTGDGKDDVGLAYNYPGARTTVFVATSTGTGFNWPVAWWDSGPGVWEWERTKLLAADFTGDGKADVSLTYNYPGSRTTVFVATSTGTGFNWPTAWWDSGPGVWEWERTKLLAADFTGDGKADVSLTYNYPGARTTVFVATSTGTALNWPAAWWDSGPGVWEWERTKLLAADFTGDGKADISLTYNYPGSRTTAFVATSTGTTLNWPVAWWDSGPGVWEAPRNKLAAGDFTGDGKADFTTLYNYDQALVRWFTATSTGTSFQWPQQWWDSGTGNWDWNRTKIS